MPWDISCKACLGLTDPLSFFWERLYLSVSEKQLCWGRILSIFLLLFLFFGEGESMGVGRGGRGRES